MSYSVCKNNMAAKIPHYLRFHAPHHHLGALFGNDWFALKAEAFARCFGTPQFLVGQTVIVMSWIAFNSFGFHKFDEYPFILLNLAFSLQSAYAAPLILLAQTRQADRDKVHSDADAQHREELAIAIQQKQELVAKQNEQMSELIQQNIQLMQTINDLGQRLEKLTSETHEMIAGKRPTC